MNTCVSMLNSMTETKCDSEEKLRNWHVPLRRWARVAEFKSQELGPMPSFHILE